MQTPIAGTGTWPTGHGAAAADRRPAVVWRGFGSQKRGGGKRARQWDGMPPEPTGIARGAPSRCGQALRGCRLPSGAQVQRSVAATASAMRSGTVASLLLAWPVQHGDGRRAGYAVLEVLSTLSFLPIYWRVHEAARWSHPGPAREREPDAAGLPPLNGCAIDLGL